MRTEIQFANLFAIEAAISGLKEERRKLQERIEGLNEENNQLKLSLARREVLIGELRAANLKEVAILKEKIAQLMLQLEQNNLVGDRRAVAKLQAEIAQLRKENESFHRQEAEFKAAFEELRHDFEEKIAAFTAENEKEHALPEPVVFDHTAAADPDGLHACSATRSRSVADAWTLTEPMATTAGNAATAGVWVSVAEADAQRAAAAAATEESNRLRGQVLALQQALQRETMQCEQNLRCMTEAALRHCVALLDRVYERERAALATLTGRVAEAASAVTATLSMDGVLETAALIDRALALASVRPPAGAGPVALRRDVPGATSVEASESPPPTSKAQAMLTSRELSSPSATNTPPMHPAEPAPFASASLPECAPHVDAGWERDLTPAASALLVRLGEVAAPILDSRYEAAALERTGSASDHEGTLGPMGLAAEADARLLGPIRAAVAAVRGDSPAAARIGQAMIKARLLVAALGHSPPPRPADAAPALHRSTGKEVTRAPSTGVNQAAGPAQSNDAANADEAAVSLSAAEAAAEAAEADLGRLADLLRGPRPRTAPACGREGQAEGGVLPARHMGATLARGGSGGRVLEAGARWMSKSAAAARVTVSGRVGGGGSNAAETAVVGFKAGTPLMVAKQVKEPKQHYFKSEASLLRNMQKRQDVPLCSELFSLVSSFKLASKGHCCMSFFLGLINNLFDIYYTIKLNHCEPLT